MKVGEALDLNLYDDLRSIEFIFVFYFYAAEFIGCMSEICHAHRLPYDDQPTSIFLGVSE